MNFKCLIPGKDLLERASGAVEKNLYYCVDFVCTYVLQNPTYHHKAEIQQLFSLYLDMLIDNEDEEEDMASLNDLNVPEFWDFVWELYNQVYCYMRPLLKDGKHCVYSLEHMEVINNRILFSVELDEVGV